MQAAESACRSGGIGRPADLCEIGVDLSEGLPYNEDVVKYSFMFLFSDRCGERLRGKQVRVLRGPATVIGLPKLADIHWETGKEERGYRP